MVKEIKRDYYLEQLIKREGNGLIKIVTEYEDVENHIYCERCLKIICLNMEWMKNTSLKWHLIYLII